MTLDRPHAPARPRRSWVSILAATWREFQDDRIPLVAAGVTFYVLLGLFPAAAALVALYGLFADPGDVRFLLDLLAQILPSQAIEFAQREIGRLAGVRETKLTLAASGGFLLWVWSANSAVNALLAALNIAFELEETRTLLVRVRTSLLFTLMFIVLTVVVIGALSAPAALATLIGPRASTVGTWLSWPILLGAMTLALTTLYRYGPSHSRIGWRWAGWGSLVVLIVWIGVSLALSTYISRFSPYDRAYGSIGTLIGLLVWIFVSIQLILLGAELNAEIENPKDERVAASKR